MFEVDKATRGAPLSRPTGPYQPLSGIAAMSLLFWGEHCIECAAPACFKTCDLYEPRSDGRCRRFIQGQVRNPSFASARGYGVEVAFKKWGKLESRGNARLMRLERVLGFERVLGSVLPILNRVGPMLASVTHDERWRDVTLRAADRLIRWLHRGVGKVSGRLLKPDAFVLEIYNPQAETVRLQVSMAIVRRELERDLGRRVLLPSLQKQIELPPGYSRQEILPAEFSPVTESGLPFNLALVPEGDSNPTLIVLTADFVAFKARQAISTQSTNLAPVKCVVWDLDNTLWDGTLLKLEQVRLHPKVANLLRQLDERGILASVASKNDPDLASRKMTEFGIADYMLFPQIGWLPKSDGIKAIAAKLNIGVDSLAFVDDSPFELAEVASALPMVMCVGADEMTNLLTHSRLQGSSSDKSRRRRLMYQEATLRESHERSFGEDFFSFLRSCDIRLKVMCYRAEHFERLCELVQRTNQLNFSGRKYKRDEIKVLLADGALEAWLLDCSDKFGSYGIVGCGIIARDADELRIEDFMLSCRVQGKFVEQAFFAVMLNGNESRLRVNFHPTGRNSPAQQVLELIGFQPDSRGGMSIDLSARQLSCDFIQVEREPLRELAIGD